MWKAIPGFEGFYEVSDHGRVRSLDRVITDTLGRVRRLKGQLRQPQVRPDGYVQVNLSSGEADVRYVHELVLTTFVGPAPEGQECRHRDGARGNNCLVNLHYGTRVENQADRVAHGTDLRGEAVYGAKLNPDAVIEIRRSRARLDDLAEQYGVCRTTIKLARARKTWAHV